MSSKTPKLAKSLPNPISGTKVIKDHLSSNVWCLWVIRVVLVIYAAFCAPNLNKEVSLIFDNVIVRLIIAALIIFLAYVDPASAILLAVSFVISIQTLNKFKVNNLQQNFVDMNHQEHMGQDHMGQEHMGQEHMGHDLHMGQEHMDHEMLGSQEEKENFTNMMQEGEQVHQLQENNQSADEQVMGRMMTPPCGHQESLDSEVMPQNNLAEEQMGMIQQEQAQRNIAIPNNDQVFTTTSQIHDAQTNQVANNQMAQVQTWANQLGPQGLNQPSGYNWGSASSGDPLARNAATF